ncbi:MAG: hypothetical protein RL149_31 [Actinomycetota bacterium]
MKRGSTVLSVATFAYFAAVMQRSSLGVAALPAAERFHTSASALAALAVFQLMVYAVMQIPVGILLDRFGARSLIAVGAFAMTLGQLFVAIASDIQFAYLGRMLVGMGDAFTFISLVRLIIAWSTFEQVPKRQQLLTSLGQLGQIASALPFAIVLANAGWQTSFSIASMIAALGAIAAAFFIRNEPTHVEHSRHEMTLRKSMQQLVQNVKFAGIRMSFWVHFTLQSSGSVFLLLWGVPYLVAGQNQTPQFASAMLILQTSLGLILGFFIGNLASKNPHLRVRYVCVNATAIIFAWATMSLMPGLAPTWLLIALVVVVGSGGPASMLAMDFARRFTPPERLGTANGFVNIGGFLATFSTMAIAGWILDVVQQLSHSASPYTPEGFRWAMSAQIVILVFGLVMFLVELKKTRKTHEV